MRECVCSKKEKRDLIAQGSPPEGDTLLERGKVLGQRVRGSHLEDRSQHLVVGVGVGGVCVCMC